MSHVEGVVIIITTEDCDNICWISCARQSLFKKASVHFLLLRYNLYRVKSQALSISDYNPQKMIIFQSPISTSVLSSTPHMVPVRQASQELPFPYHLVWQQAEAQRG